MTIFRNCPIAGWNRQALCGVFLSVLLAVAHGAGNDWMAGIGGGTRLSRVTIPGTHNSGARLEPWPGTAKCQSVSISDQLGFGVRFLDVRCRHVSDAFVIHHGSVYQELSFGGVLDQVYAFLDANPSECVLMSIKQEHTAEGNRRSFEATFDSYVSANPGKWWLGTGVPALDDVRGRIVLVRRFGAAVSKGINATNWPDNTTFQVNSLSVQDNYVVSDNATKWDQVSSALTAASSETNADILHLNFGSGYKPGFLSIPDIPTVSNYINPQIAGHFTGLAPGHHGCVVMDFADSGRCRLIYMANVFAPEPPADDTADPDRDGLNNLLEYALGTDPNVPNAATITHDMVTIGGTRFLRIIIARNPAATDIIFTVEVTADFTSWSSAGTVIEADTATSLIVRDAVGGSRRFMRLRVNRAP